MMIAGSRTSMRLAVVVTLSLVLAAVVVLRNTGPGERELSAVFPRTTSLYEGARVKVLGVDVGTVRSIEVIGTSVRARIRYAADVKLPEDVHAMIVPPSIVGDRFVQLAPVYESGPVLPDGARLGLDRTDVPLELDETFRQLDDLATALGPTGANKDGAVSRLVAAAADNLRGNGGELNRTMRATAGLLATLAGSSSDIGGTVDNMAAVTDNLRGNDAALRRFITLFSRVSTELNGNGAELTAAVEQLQESLALLADFTRQHKAGLTRATSQLSDVTGTLSAHTEELETMLKLAPVGLTSLLNSSEPTNWDPARPNASTPTGRTSSAVLRGALFDDLDIQLSYLLAGVCAQLPTGSAAQLAPLCALIESSGDDLGGILTSAIRTGLGASSGPTSLSGLLGGAR